MKPHETTSFFCFYCIISKKVYNIISSSLLYYLLIIHRFIPEAIKLRGNGDTMLIGGYNITAEIISLVLSSFLVFLMFYSNPRKTNSYKIIYYGVLISIVAIITQIALIYVSSRPDVYSKDFDTYLCCFYLIPYYFLLTDNPDNPFTSQRNSKRHSPFRFIFGYHFTPGYLHFKCNFIPEY